MALPLPVVVKLTGNVARPFILAKASLRDECSVNELVVIEPVK